MSKAAKVAIALVVAAITALLLHGMAHDVMGISLQAIRTDSLTGAGVIGIAYVASTFFDRSR